MAPFTLIRFVMISFFCVQDTRSHYFVFVQKWREIHSFISAHIDLPDKKYVAKDIRFCAFTLLWFCEDHIEYWGEYSSAFESLRFCALFKVFSKPSIFVENPLLIAFSKTSVFVAFIFADQSENFHKKEVFSFRFCTKTMHCERDLSTLGVINLKSEHSLRLTWDN